MALEFPSQPQTVGTPYEAPNGITYIWDGVKWNSAGAPGTGNFNLGNLYVIDQTIAGLNETDNIFITGNVEVGSLATAGFSIGETEITVDNGNLYLDGIAIGGGNGSELVAGDYSVTLYPNGNMVMPGTISSTVAGIPEFNSTTDLNLNAVNRVNIVNSPLNLGSVIPSNIIGKPGDIIYHPALQEIQAYINGAWENLLRTAENQNVRLPQGGAFQRADGVRAAWFTELPTDISQLTDNNNLLTTQSITLQNIDIDGGGAYSIYETGLLFADGGFGSSRFGPSDTVFDGAGASGGYTNSLNGGGA